MNGSALTLVQLECQEVIRLVGFHEVIGLRETTARFTGFLDYNFAADSVIRAVRNLVRETAAPYQIGLP